MASQSLSTSYLESGWCHHSAVLDAERLPDETPVRSLCPRMVCTKCGLVGADVRPNWSPLTGPRRAEQASAG